VASPVGPYVDAISHGETGFLAGTEEDWYTYLKALIQNATLREEVGRRAYESVLWRHSPERRGKLLALILEHELSNHVARGEGGRPLQSGAFFQVSGCV
jgi:hypothetical protein